MGAHMFQVDPYLLRGLTSEQQLRMKEIALNTELRMKSCCDVKFSGKERELALQEQLNRERMCCCTKVAQANACCCKMGG